MSCLVLNISPPVMLGCCWPCSWWEANCCAGQIWSEKLWEVSMKASKWYFLAYYFLSCIILWNGYTTPITFLVFKLNLGKKILHFVRSKIEILGHMTSMSMFSFLPELLCIVELVLIVQLILLFTCDNLVFTAKLYLWRNFQSVLQAMCTYVPCIGG